MGTGAKMSHQALNCEVPCPFCGSEGHGFIPSRFFSDSSNFNVLEFAWTQVVRDIRPVSSMLRVNCNCASHLGGFCWPTWEKRVSIMFSHLFDSQKLNALGLELEHKFHIYVKDGTQADGGLSLCIPAWKNPSFFLIFFNLSDLQKWIVLLRKWFFQIHAIREVAL